MIAGGIAYIRKSGPPLTGPTPEVRRAFAADRAGGR